MKCALIVLAVAVATVSSAAPAGWDHGDKRYSGLPDDVRPRKAVEPRSSTQSDNTFLPGPHGQRCILDDRDIHDPNYLHEDDEGRVCCCSLCKPGQYARRLCECDESGSELPAPGKDTDCFPLVEGSQFMDKHNKCTQPYSCTARCNAHQHKVKDCTRESDLGCECDHGWYNPYPPDEGNFPVRVPETCRPIPHCPAGKEPIKVEDAGWIEYECESCSSGYFKVEGQSWKQCKPRRHCLIQQGSATSDNVCLNDDIVAALQLENQEPHTEEQTHKPTDASPEMMYHDQTDALDGPSTESLAQAAPTSSESTPLADETSRTSALLEDVDTQTRELDPPPVCIAPGWRPEAYIAMGATGAIVVYLVFEYTFVAWIRSKYDKPSK